MKHWVMGMVLAAVTASVAEYATVDLGESPVRMPTLTKALSLDVISTDATRTVTASVVRAVSSYTNCTRVAVVTNGIGEVSTLTNRWMGLKETKVYTNALGDVTCTGGAGRSDIGKFILGGDAVIATGITNEGETVKAKLIIER